MVNVPVISLYNVSMGYPSERQEPVLSDISFACNGGELIGIAGMNGSGKTTLLRSIAGLLPLMAGSVSINGTQLSGMSPHMRARVVSVVFTGRIGGFNLTVHDAVAAGRMPYTDAFHRLTAQDKEIVRKAMKVAGIHDMAGKLLENISDGQYQKTMVARAMAQQTPAILLDEPNAFLDFASKHELFRMLARMCETERKCVLVSSHDLDMVLRYCSRVLLVSGATVTSLSIGEAKQHEGFLSLGGGYL